jgi:hypothetical protein
MALKVLLVPYVYESGYDTVFEHAADKLRSKGHEVTVQAGDLATMDLGEYDFLYTNHQVEDSSIRERVRTIGGVCWTRAQWLQMLEMHHIPTMDWVIAPKRLDLPVSFLRWRTTRLIIKGCFSARGSGTTTFRPWHIMQLKWNRQLDILCAEVNKNDGDVWKAELLNGEILTSWVSRSSPLRKKAGARLVKGIDGAYGDRELISLPDQLCEKLCTLSRELTNYGISQVSVDIMRDPEGTLRAIEINSGNVAMWWTSQFEDFRERFADSVLQLAERYAG